MQPTAWNDSGGRGAALLRNWIAESADRDDGIIKTLLRTAAPFICNDTEQLHADEGLKRILAEADLRSIVAMPLSIDGTPVGALVLAAPSAGVLGEEELQNVSREWRSTPTMVRTRTHSCRTPKRLGQGVEALLRWNEPGAGLVLPGEFLPLLKSTQLIVVSPVQRRHQDFVQRFSDICAPLAQIGGGLDIEITEGLLQSDSEEIGKLEALRRAGVQIAIDDFGTGHSSLSRLAELPIDTLKIDRTFTSRLARNGSGRSVVRTILALARPFELTVIAEGVEPQEELRLLAVTRCKVLCWRGLCPATG